MTAALLTDSRQRSLALFAASKLTSTVEIRRDRRFCCVAVATHGKLRTCWEGESNQAGADSRSVGGGVGRLFRAPFLTVDLAEGATVADLYARLTDTEPDAAPALRSALAVVAGKHAGRDDVLRHRQEVALLLPISGG